MKYLLSIVLTLSVISCKGIHSEKSTPSKSEPQVSKQIAPFTVNDLGMAVTPEQNRPVSFTNKRSAYWYTQTHENNHPEHTWFQGMNIAQKRVFAGYQLLVDGIPLDPKSSTVTVYPHKMVRRYNNGVIETLSMIDNQDAIIIQLDGVKNTASIRVTGEQTSVYRHNEATIQYKSTEAPNAIIGVMAIDGEASLQNEASFSALRPKGFLIVVENNDAKLSQTFQLLQEQKETLLNQRELRLNNILAQHAFVYTNDPEFNLALAWIHLNMDQLMTNQRGQGIYAGLPWFNEYWGRDNFIALPGASLVTGQFAWARNIITSFAKFQETNPDSKFYGRVPNIVKVGEIDYHTTDGTPRFINQMLDYIKYSGDVSLIEEMYPTVKRSIEGSLKNWVDKNGYLVHENNETWMDAREHETKRAYSPRGNRANDIQALWYQQLLTGVYFAQQVGEESQAMLWKEHANALKTAFNNDFVKSDLDWIVDRIDTDNQKDTQLRPNQFFAFELVNDESKKISALKSGWEQLVYPWGVASLTNEDPFFHPYHLAWEHYHKDQAYHNGTVWLWNNGIAMQRMVEFNQQNIAYQLFKNMNMFALERGVVGGLAENSNAYPTEEQQWPTLTGTYLQAWSNSEHLRVWYQYFVGFRPDMIKNNITLAPRLPNDVTKLNTKLNVANGSVEFNYQENTQRHFNYQFKQVNTQVTIDIAGYKPFDVDVIEGDRVEITDDGNQMHVKHITNGQTYHTDYQVDLLEKSKLKHFDKVLGDTSFAVPKPIKQHKVINL